MLKSLKVHYFLFLTLTSCGINSTYVREDIKFPLAGIPKKEEIKNTIFLIGDAGKPKLDIQEPTFTALEKAAAINADKNVIIFLGDNVYPNGMVDRIDDDRKVSEQYLEEQIIVVKKSGAQGIFIPGNHDWEQGGKNGKRYLKNQEEYINSLNLSNIHFLPSNGCPGPKFVDFANNIRVVFLDTQWWLQKEKDFKNPDSSCSNHSENEIIASLEQVMNTEDGFHKIVVGHHPFKTHGMHGGFFDWKDHIFPLTNLYPWMWLPLPILGSGYPLFRNSIQDLSAEEYQNMINKIENVFEKHPPIAYASGHDHTLQVIKTDKDYLQLVSGKGISAHNNVVTQEENTIFAGVNAGFMRIDFLKSGKIRLGVIEPVNDGKESREVFSMWIKNNT